MGSDWAILLGLSGAFGGSAMSKSFKSLEFELTWPRSGAMYSYGFGDPASGFTCSRWGAFVEWLGPVHALLLAPSDGAVGASC